MNSSASAVLLTGLYGSGKTTVLEEIAALLEARSSAYAAVDLDWLWWFAAGEPDEHVARDVLRANLAALVATYRGLGISRFVLAIHARSAADLDVVRAAVGMPMIVVRLTAPIEVIEHRLRQAVTTGRADDLRVALDDHAGNVGVGFEDFVLPNVGAPGEVARAALEIVGWDVDG